MYTNSIRLWALLLLVAPLVACEDKTPPTLHASPESGSTLDGDTPIFLTFDHPMNVARYRLEGELGAQSNGGVWNEQQPRKVLEVRPSAGWSGGSDQQLLVYGLDEKGQSLVPVALTYDVLPQITISPDNGATLTADEAIELRLDVAVDPAATQMSGVLEGEVAAGGWSGDQTRLIIAPTEYWTAGRARDLQLLLHDHDGHEKQVVLSYDILPATPRVSVESWDHYNRIRWTAVRGAQGYTVTWTDAGGDSTVVTVQDLLFHHHGVSNNEVLYYQVSAFNEVGAGASSGEVGVTAHDVRLAGLLRDTIIPDAGLRQCVEMHINSVTVYVHDLRWFNCDRVALTSLQGLDRLTSLITLYLTSSQTGDLGALRGLSNLTFLVLQNNHITDVSALAGLTALHDLNLSNNEVSDVSPLRHLSALADAGELNLANNAITRGVAALSTLSGINRLDLSGNPGVPCADLTALVSALGEGVVVQPESCAP